MENFSTLDRQQENENEMRWKEYADNFRQIFFSIPTIVKVVRKENKFSKLKLWMDFFQNAK